MLTIILPTIFLSLAVGIGINLIYKHIKGRNLIDPIPLLCTSVAVVLLAIIVVILGWYIGKSSRMTYYEYWGGWETRAIKNEVKCTRDGPCRNEYDCDPYPVSYSCNCTKNGCSTCYRTEYHDCPYSDTEYDYYVNTTLGRFTIDVGRFPDNPRSHIWREGEDIPDSVIENAGVGDPKFWLAVKKRLEASNPGPVFVKKTYVNYLYASERTILKQYSQDIAFYKKSGLLPKFDQNDIYNFYHSNKLYVVKQQIDTKTWDKKLETFNAAFGERLQGALYFVVVNSKVIGTNPWGYMYALKAHWQDITVYDKDSLPKNAVVVIVATDGKTIEWVKSFTGMPMGNDLMTNKISSTLAGQPFDPQIVFGDIRKDFSKQKQIGLLQNIVFGIQEKATTFKRISMSMDANDKGGAGSGYDYLEKEIRPTNTFICVLTILSMIICCLPWAIAIFITQNRKYC